MLDELRNQVCQANHDLVRHGLVTLTWGNVSGIDRSRGLVAIKPSGVPYEDLESEHIVIVDLNGEVAEGQMKPSSDTATHLRLYTAFASIGGITHTHSRFATMFAQARHSIPCLGTTHADHFNGPIPVTRPLTDEEVRADYEGHTGDVIVEAFEQLDPVATPAVLVAGHGPFTWGVDSLASVENAVALEAVVEMALGTRQIDRDAMELEDYVREQHYYRKHGAGATYGQSK